MANRMNSRRTPFKTKEELMRFQVLTVANMKMAVFWVVALCSLIPVYQ
jgi:hypothetical protein